METTGEKRDYSRLSDQHPTLNIENDRLTELASPAAKPDTIMQAAASSNLRGGSKLSQLSYSRPFAYPDMNLASVTKKAKYRELFTDHFENARKEPSVWKP